MSLIELQNHRFIACGFSFYYNNRMEDIYEEIFIGGIRSCSYFSGCGNKKQDTEVNYFNGAGSLKSDSGRYATGVIYDDNTYYLKTSRGYVYTDKDKCYSICLDATCSHSGTGCIADENNNYFMLHGDLYSADGDIKKCDTGDVVYKDVKPDKYNTEEYSTYATDIDEVAVYNDKYMILKEKDIRIY